MMPKIKKLGKYEIVAELGSGAMGRVYKAKDPSIDRFVALKTINLSLTFSDKERSEFLERFYREARTAGQLSHQNIITIYEVAHDSEYDLSFIAMEFASGAELKDIISSPASVPLHQSIKLVSQIADALDYAHQHGIVHRDIKPANIILNSKGVLKITDFGIARIETSNLTDTGKFLGTPYYMSPEQIDGKTIDGRSDLFALGVIFYQLLTKTMPFQGDSVAAVTYAIVHKTPQKPSMMEPSVPEQIDRAVMKLLSKDRDKRYSSGRELIDDLKSAEEKINRDLNKKNIAKIGSEKLSSTMSWFIKQAKPVRHRKILSLVSASAAALLIIAFLLVTGEEKSEPYSYRNPVRVEIPVVQSEKLFSEFNSSELIPEKIKKTETVLPATKPYSESGSTIMLNEPGKELGGIVPSEEQQMASVFVKLKHDLKDGGKIIIASNGMNYMDEKVPPKTGIFKKLKKGTSQKPEWDSVELPSGKNTFTFTISSENLKNDAVLNTELEIPSDGSFKLLLNIDNQGTLEIQ